MLSQSDHRVAYLAVALDFELYFWLDGEGQHLHLNPGALVKTQSLVARHEFLLVVEGLDDDTDEELHEKHADANDQHHCVDDEE